MQMLLLHSSTFCSRIERNHFAVLTTTKKSFSSLISTFFFVLFVRSLTNMYVFSFVPFFFLCFHLYFEQIYLRSTKFLVWWLVVCGMREFFFLFFSFSLSFVNFENTFIHEVRAKHKRKVELEVGRK